MNVVLPKPLRESRETVTFSRADWEALIDAMEDAEDVAAVAERKALEAAIGVAMARRDYLTGDELNRLLDWESPLRVWREKRGLSQRALARQARVSPSYLAEIESGQKPGSADALLKLARALNVSVESLVSSNKLQVAADHLKSVAASGVSEVDAITEGTRVINKLGAHNITGTDLAELKEQLHEVARRYQSAGHDRAHVAMRAIIQTIPA